MIEQKDEAHSRALQRTFFLVLAAAFGISISGWIYNVHRWLVEPTAVYNAAGPQENNYWASAQFDIAAIRLENSLLRFSMQSPTDATPVRIQFQVVLSKLSLLSQPSEATSSAMQVPAYRNTVEKLQHNFRTLEPLIDQLNTKPKLASTIAARVKQLEEATSDLAQAVGDAEVKQHDAQLRDFLKKRQIFYATTAAVSLTVTTTLFVLIVLLYQHRVTVLARERATRAAQDALSAKNAFLGVIGHELRTPLQTITSSIDALSDRPHSARDMKIILRLELAAQQMIAQMRDLTDYSRLEAGKLEIRQDVLDVAAVLLNIIEENAPRAHEKNLTIRFETNLTDTLGFTDPLRIHQIFSNLVDNAIKYSDGGEIVVRLGQAASHRAADKSRQLQVDVQDQGIGIPSEKIEAMFEPFTQMDQSNTRRHEGVGMGLAIVRRLITLLGGEIQVRSEIGVGSCFTVLLPSLPCPDLARPHPIAAMSQMNQPATLTNKRVLVVDDQEAVRDAFAHMLSSLHIHFETSPNADDALGLLSVFQYDALLLDIQMPGKDGYAMLHELRLGSGPNKNIPVIAISAFAQDVYDHAKGNLFSDYLMKPVRIDSLRDALAHAISQLTPA